MSTPNAPYQVIDANINRISEGLRVIEEYFRFLAQDKERTETIVKLRREISRSNPSISNCLSIRNTEKDMRAFDPVPKRKSISDILVANFKRVQEAGRVMEEYTGDMRYNRLRYEMYMLEKETLLPLLKPVLENGIYLISHEIDILKYGLEKKVSIVQLRDKNGNKQDLYEKAMAFAPLAKAAGIPFIVNDFIDIALLSNADGLHTGQDDISVTALRTILGPDKILGRTTHTPSQGIIAEKEGADYVSVGPIWKTPSKPNREGIGFDYLKQATEILSIPFVAIGGINLKNIDQILPESPPLIGLIRDYKSIPNIQAKITANCER